MSNISWHWDAVISGFDFFLDGLKIKPQIVFITSKAEYALKAFDYDATDWQKNPSRLIGLMLLSKGYWFISTKADTEKKRESIFFIKVIWKTKDFHFKIKLKPLVIM
jgi:DNA-binding LytR/AlgR family response regulator